jgi:hypothetical protein
MGKRSDFKRAKLDYYPTPLSAVLPLLLHVNKGSTFCEPCAGEGVLINHLELSGGLRCVSAFDVQPQTYAIRMHDASFITEADLMDASLIITNPPWDRPVLHQIIERCSILRPTWLLFDADWMHTSQAKQHLQICRKIVSVGRVKWIEGSKNTGMENCCWYLFDANSSSTTEFIGRK